jgi:hypothetical protein
VGEEASLAGHGQEAGGRAGGKSRSVQDACGRVGLGVWDMKYHSR